MAWQAAPFREYFIGKVGAKEASAASYASNLRKIDTFVGGLDEKIGQLGFAGIMDWAKVQSTGPFADYGSNLRSALKRYVTFLVDAADPDASITDEGSSEPAEADRETTTFRYEQELQAAIRRDISRIEPGLVIADGGVERSVATGRIDILAEATDGRFVVIELKAGMCSSGALEQALGYTEDLEQETGKACRTILIAGDFPERIRSAVRRVKDITLLTYRLELAFQPA